jgi:ATP-dependent Clp protease adapter protein ClpS
MHRERTWAHQVGGRRARASALGTRARKVQEPRAVRVYMRAKGAGPACVQSGAAHLARWKLNKLRSHSLAQVARTYCQSVC